MLERYDVIVAGLGHNGLTTLALLARAGLKVLGLEARSTPGGACKTTESFAKVPGQKVSRFAYLYGLTPPEMEEALEINVPKLRRDPWYFVPGLDGKYLLSGSDQQAMKGLFDTFYTEKDWKAHCAMQELLEQIRSFVYPAWLETPLSVEDTAAKYLPERLRRQFINLCRGSVGDFLSQFDWETESLPVMYATTDGFTSAYGTWNSPGTGANFLAHNMCRLNSDGTWMIVRGGMGTLTRLIAQKAIECGAKIWTDAPVRSVLHEGGVTKGVVLENGTTVRAPVVVCGCDPYRIRDMVGADSVPGDFRARLAEYAKYPGSSMKINLALRRHPDFSCLPEDKGQFVTTTHILPAVPDLVKTVIRSFEQARDGMLPDWPLVELMFHSKLDPSICGTQGYQTAGIFCQWVPNKFADGSSWSANETRAVERVFEICGLYAPGFRDLVLDYDVLTPQSIETEVGITNGHICMVDHKFFGAERVPFRWPGLQGLYTGSAACHPGGGVTCCPGAGVANVVLGDLGRKPYQFVKRS